MNANQEDLDLFSESSSGSKLVEDYADFVAKRQAWLTEGNHHQRIVDSASDYALFLKRRRERLHDDLDTEEPSLFTKFFSWLFGTDQE